MKIRIGFISNSSSSSFVVWNFDGREFLLNEKQIKLLEDFGFIPSDTYSIMDVECRTEKELRKKDESMRPLSYVYSVHCNQEDVIEYLVNHKIPFRSLCHYGHWVCLFDGKTIYRIPNFGLQAEMHGVEDIYNDFDKVDLDKLIKIETINDYVEDSNREIKYEI